jgi:hypothetical protein
MFLILPLLTIFGLIPLTHFAFNSTSADVPSGASSDIDINIQIENPFQDNTPKHVYSLTTSERQMRFAKVAVVCIWISVILSILSWIGRAFGLWCLP